jgi:hypothetical protein
MSAIEVNYLFGERVRGTLVLDLDQFSGARLSDPMFEDEVIGIIRDAVMTDMEDGVVIVNLESVVDWVKRKKEALT